MKIENIDRAVKIRSEIASAELNLFIVKRILSEDVGLSLFIKSCAFNEVQSIENYSEKIVEELIKRKELLECRISELKKEIEKL